MLKTSPLCLKPTVFRSQTAWHQEFQVKMKSFNKFDMTFQRKNFSTETNFSQSINESNEKRIVIKTKRRTA